MMDNKINIIIDKSSSIPLHIQVEKELKRLIKNGTFKKLSPQITDKFLEKELKVSRNTVRQAISRLVDEGLIIRKRSKGISLVDDASKSISETTDGLSFTESVIKKGQKPGGKTIASEVITAPEEVLKALSLKKNERVFHIKRVRYIDDDPISIVNYYIPIKVAPTISEDDFSETGPNQSSHYILERFYDHQVLKWIESIKAIKITREDAKILKIPEESPVIVRSDVVYSTEGRIIAYNKIMMTENYEITGLVYKKERL